MSLKPRQILDCIAQTLYDKKGFNILTLNVEGLSTLTDYFVIAEGSNDKHVTSLAKAVIKELKSQGEQPIHVEGLPSGDWVVIDFLGVVVHLFMPGMRDKYALEELWHRGEVVDVKIKVKNTL